MAKKEKLDFLSFTKDEKRNEIFEKFSLIPEKSKEKKVDLKCTETRPKLDLKCTQSGPKVDLKCTESRPKVDRKVDLNLALLSLSGKELEMVYFFHEECQKNGNLTTEKLSISYIKNKLNCTEIGTKRTIQRIFKKGILQKKFTKNGRAGWTIYELPKVVYSHILEEKSGPKLDRKVDLNASSSSINIYTKNITTTPLRSVDSIETPEDSVKTWEAIDFSLLTDIGFKEIHISQLLEKGDLTPEEVQESIFAFAYDLKHNPSLLRIKTTPLNLFLGILKRGCPYFPSKEYESEFKKHYEKHKREREARKLQDQEYLDKHRQETYSDWVEKLSLKEKSEILDIDTGFMSKMPVQAIRKGLEEYYALKVYEPLGQGLKKGG